ncbi:hypothetical protein ACJMK2_035991 [Sinanodonta woodiana]|uniref:Uncharacterized protein n=1 Tax=Sinanodonta woodiana TaxID=1069815 RepID=A0ABD3WGZ9_SINWO
MLLKLEKFNEHATSEMNTCQAVVTPECEKGNVSKSKGVRTALVSLLFEFNANENNESLSIGDRQKKDASLILLEEKNVPVHISQRMSTILVEFSGVKFKAFSRSGIQYLRYIENGVLRWLLKEFPFASHVVICEEKYSFTPDDLKSMTRATKKKKRKLTYTT